MPTPGLVPIQPRPPVSPYHSGYLEANHAGTYQASGTLYQMPRGTYLPESDAQRVWFMGVRDSVADRAFPNTRPPRRPKVQII